ncbi:histamine N-methyltransferase-like isoform 2-T2 [Clarias gariepinus]|uniref:histamine N-methyltransferase-like isoform X2 n=1 Tax=Clarias gariepinus TaxID=13013 RepID=UPI00234D952F|nr:histamine N-methyltransferase-like isoform X2 [Clarias gariepinus]
MAGQTKSLSLGDDYSRYLKSFEVFLERSSEQQSMTDFIHNTLPDILTTYIVGAGKSTLNVMGLGSGSGKIDLEILSQLHTKYPEASMENEVVEPSGDMLHKYKDLVSKMPGLDHITFRWNQMTASEFESDWKQRNTDKTLDFIHMIQMLYYVNDPEATISFFRSLLHKDGKLLIILVSGQGGWSKLWKTYQAQLCKPGISQSLTASDVKDFLNTNGIPYLSYTLPSQMDITDCFTTGDEKGELLLDFLTEVMEFRKNASPELKAGVLELLRHPECSQEVDGRVIFNNNLEALVLNP